MKYYFLSLFLQLIIILPLSITAQENKPVTDIEQAHPDTTKPTSDTVATEPEDSLDSTFADSLKNRLPGTPVNLNDFKTSFDQVITRKDEILIVKVVENNIFDIHFTYPLNTTVNIMDKARVKTIIFSGGHSEIIATATDIEEEKYDSLTIVDEKDWEKVDTSTLAETISGLTDKGEVSVKYEADKFNMPSELMEKNAIIILKKRTARLKAHVLFIEDIQFQRAYGELPYVEIKGRAYGF